MQTNNNTVLVTGGTRGIGQAIANLFLENNNQVIVTGRSEKALKEAEKAGFIPSNAI